MCRMHLLLLALWAGGAAGFNMIGFRAHTSLHRATWAMPARSMPPQAVVIEISSQEEFDKALDGAGASLVVIDYSTSWCGPCKIIAPKFDEFSEQYKNVAFLKVWRLSCCPCNRRYTTRATCRTCCTCMCTPHVLYMHVFVTVHALVR